MTAQAEVIADPIRHPLWLTYQWEVEKLTAQFRTRLALVVAVVAPAVFGVGLKLATDVPADTLFGRWVGDSGYAIPLVVLSFAGSWGFPVLVCLVAGDIFSAEDHHHTWTSLLTRSVGRRTIFGGKILAAATYSLVVIILLTLSSTLSGLLSVGHQPLVGLTGNVIGAGHALILVLLSWISVLPAVISFAAMGVLVSVITRNSIAGILVPTVIGLLLQLLLLVGGVMDSVRAYVPGASFQAWLGLFAGPPFRGPLLIGLVASAVYAIAFTSVAWLAFRRRDVTAA